MIFIPRKRLDVANYSRKLAHGALNEEDLEDTEDGNEVMSLRVILHQIFLLAQGYCNGSVLKLFLYVGNGIHGL